MGRSCGHNRVVLLLAGAAAYSRWQAPRWLLTSIGGLLPVSHT